MQAKCFPHDAVHVLQILHLLVADLLREFAKEESKNLVHADRVDLLLETASNHFVARDVKGGVGEGVGRGVIACTSW